MNQNALPKIGGWKKFKKILFTIFVGQFALAPGVWADEPQFLSGHVPAVVARLQPIGALPVDSRLNLAIGLPLRNKEALAALLHDIYDPASPNFHHYLTPEQFAEKFGPTEQDYQAVTAFARANGLQVTTTYANRQLLDVSGSAGDIERALHLTLKVYRHPTENRTFYAPAVEPSLNLSVPILHISGLDNYELPRPHLVANHITIGQNALSNAGSGINGTYMGKDFRAAYVPDTTLGGTGQTIGLFEYDGYNPGDIAYYENAAGLPNTPLQNVLIDGASGQPSGSSADVEVALDIEMAISMSTNLTSVIVYEAPPGAPFVDLLDQMANDNQVRQFSCSWYVPGGTAEPTADQIWQQMAAQGQSFFNASGDSDAYTGLISFPGDTPYVTQVGGTTLTTSGPDGTWVSETVWNWGNGIGSSGGVSTQYPIPSWQTNISMAANKGSNVRRNTPDVAMAADNIYVRADGFDYSVGGTSCAAPLWAGFAALVNQQAAASGQSPIGLVNLAVDAIGTSTNYASAFHDITTGNNTWRGSPAKFHAVSGYDLCTGWGTPAGQTLINALANPEALIITPAAGFVSVGGLGGPFTITSQVLSVTNAGTNTLNWTLSNTSAWLNVSSGGGTLTPGGAAAAVTVSLNSAASNLVVGTYSATLWFTNVSDGFGQGRQFALSIISPPAITTQPVDEAVLQGAPAGFSVQVTGGSPLFFQWQDDGTNLTDDGNISGSATSNLTINAVSPANVGTYSVVITNIAGTVTSSNALLTIIPSQPVITLQPTNLTALLGSAAQFNVSVIGTTPYNYQWYWNGTNELAGATNAALTLNDVQLTNAGEYSVTISNLYGATNSSEASLTVTTSGMFVVPVGLANVEGSGSSADLSYNGREQDVYGASYFPTQTIVITGIRFRPTVNGGGQAFTNTISNIQFSLSSTTNSADQLSSTFADNIGTNVTTVFSGSLPLSSEYAGPSAGPKAFDMVVNFTTPFVYNPSSGNLLLDIQDFSGEATSYTDGQNSPSDLGSRVSANGASSTSGTPDSSCAVLEIAYTLANQSPTIVLEPTNQTVATGNPVSFEVAVVSAAPLSYQWYWNETNELAGATNAALTLNDVQLTNAGEYSVTISNLYGATVSSNALLNVITLSPTIVLEPTNQTVLMDGSATFNVGITGSQPLNYQWYWNGTNLITGATNAALTLNDVQLTNAGEYSVTVSNLYGGTNSSEALLTVTTSGAFVVPANLANVAGPASSGDLTAAVREQDVYGASYFPTQTIVITGIRFRPTVNGGGQAFTNTISNIQFSLSSTTNAPYQLSSIFADNIGTNVTTVFSGSLPLSSQYAGPANGPKAFDMVVNFTTPFVYNPSSGNLLVDIQDFSGEMTSYTDGGNSSSEMASRISEPGGNATSGVADDGCAVLEIAYTLANQPPTIVLEPTNQTVATGNPVSFEVAAVSAAPLSYQWYWNETNELAGATNAALTLNDVQLTNAGEYSVTISNLYGATVSSNALLNVITLSPTIVLEPTNQTVLMDGSATFNVSATGSQPLNYQWYWNETNELAGATNAALTLNDVQLTNAGEYSVTISDLYGVTNSSEALLTVTASTVLVVPVGLANVEGSGSSANLSYDDREQDVYGASYFPTQTIVITGIRFRPTVNGGGQAFTNTISNIQFSLSSTTNSVDQLSSTFADNIGTNVTTVFSGSLPLSSQYAGPANGPKAFDMVVNFTTPFVYNPSSGNLLLDIQDFSGEPTSYTDGQNSPSDLGSRVSAVGASSTSGTPDSSCAVLEIVYTVAGQPPTIVLEPTNETVLVGDSATFNVSATGSQPLNYQWYWNGTNVITGATNAALTLNDVQLTNAGEYSVTVSNLYGVTNSSEASLTVNTFGAFVVPASLANVEGPGSSGDLTAAVREQSVYGASYFPTQTIVITGIRFRPDTSTGQAFTNTISNIQFSLSSTTNAPYQLSSIFADNIGTNVTTVFSGSLPLSSQYAGPVDGPKAFDMVVNFTTPFVYNPSSGNLLVDIQDFSGEMTSYTDGGSSSSEMASRISEPGGNATSGVADDGCAVLEIIYAVANQSPIIVTQPTNQAVLVGGSATFNMSVIGVQPLNCQWYWNGTNALAGATNAALTLNDVQLTNAGEYSVTVSNLYGVTNSSEALLTVNDFLDHFVWSQISSTQFVNRPFTVTVQAQDPNNELFTNFTGTANLTSTNGIAVNPGVSPNFIQGTWTGSITISQTVSNLVLQANNGLGKTGLANPLNIISPPSLTTVSEGGLLLIFWPVTPSGFVLETSGSLSPPDWVQVSSPPLQIGDQNLISVGISGTNNSFYRLQFSSP